MNLVNLRRLVILFPKFPILPILPIFPIVPIVPISMNPVRSALTFAQLYVASLYLCHYEVAAADEDSIVSRGEALSTKHRLADSCSALIVKAKALGNGCNILDIAGTLNLRAGEDIVSLAG